KLGICRSLEENFRDRGRAVALFADTPVTGALGSALAVHAAVVLQPRDAQAGEAVAVDETLPGEEFLDRQLVAVAGVLEADRPRTDGGDDLRLAPDHPPLG